MIYAIDFGTSNSLLAAKKESQILGPLELETQSSGDRSIFRSVMFYPLNGDSPEFGQSAIHKYSQNAGEGRLIRSIKKYLPAQSFQSTRIGNRSYRIEELVGRFLKEMKNRADQVYGEDVTQVIMGRPALFSEVKEDDDLAESRLRRAAIYAGFKEVEFFPEPLAAAYDFRKTISREQILLTVDLGGGTSDFTVLKISPHSFSKDDVLAIGGVSVAGDRIDGEIMDKQVSPFFGSKSQYQLPMSRNVLVMPASIRRRLMAPADITLMNQSDIMSFVEEVKKCATSKADAQCLNSLIHLISDNLGFSLFENIEKSKRDVCREKEARFEFKAQEIDVSTTFNYEIFLKDVQPVVDKIFVALNEVLKKASSKPVKLT